MKPKKNSGEELTFEKIWAAIQETNEQVKAIRRELDENAQHGKEPERRRAEFDREFDDWYGGSKLIGEVDEYSLASHLVTKFRELNLEFTCTSGEVTIANKKHNIFTGYSASLANDDIEIAVKINIEPDIKDVDSFIICMEKIRKHADLYKNYNRMYRGAFAGTDIRESVREYALKKGFYVIVPEGDTLKIIVPEGEYQIREW